MVTKKQKDKLLEKYIKESTPYDKEYKYLSRVITSRKVIIQSENAMLDAEEQRLKELKQLIKDYKNE